MWALLGTACLLKLWVWYPEMLTQRWQDVQAGMFYFSVKLEPIFLLPPLILLKVAKLSFLFVAFLFPTPLSSWLDIFLPCCHSKGKGEKLRPV